MVITLQCEIIAPKVSMLQSDGAEYIRVALPSYLLDGACIKSSILSNKSRKHFYTKHENSLIYNNINCNACRFSCHAGSDTASYCHWHRSTGR